MDFWFAIDVKYHHMIILHFFYDIQLWVNEQWRHPKVEEHNLMIFINIYTIVAYKIWTVGKNQLENMNQKGHIGL